MKNIILFAVNKLIYRELKYNLIISRSYRFKKNLKSSILALIYSRAF